MLLVEVCWCWNYAAAGSMLLLEVCCCRGSLGWTHLLPAMAPTFLLLVSLFFVPLFLGPLFFVLLFSGPLFFVFYSLSLISFGTCVFSRLVGKPGNQGGSLHDPKDLLVYGRQASDLLFYRRELNTREVYTCRRLPKAFFRLIIFDRCTSPSSSCVASSFCCGRESSRLLHQYATHSRHVVEDI